MMLREQWWIKIIWMIKKNLKKSIELIFLQTDWLPETILNTFMPLSRKLESETS